LDAEIISAWRNDNCEWIFMKFYIMIARHFHIFLNNLFKNFFAIPLQALYIQRLSYPKRAHKLYNTRPAFEFFALSAP